MKRNEMLIRMQKFYGIKNVMVEGGYITVAEFMDELLSYMQDNKGMLPPVYLKKICSSMSGGSINVEVSEWEDEDKEA